MKFKNRKTGEIVTIITFSGNTTRNTLDYVDYIDSKGNEVHGLGLNYYWDFEEEPEEGGDVNGWKIPDNINELLKEHAGRYQFLSQENEARLMIAKDILCSLIVNSNNNYNTESIVKRSLEIADKLIEEWKK